MNKRAKILPLLLILSIVLGFLPGITPVEANAAYYTGSTHVATISNYNGYTGMQDMATVDKLSLDNATGSMEMTATNGTYWGRVAGLRTGYRRLRLLRQSLLRIPCMNQISSPVRLIPDGRAIWECRMHNAGSWYSLRQ